MDRLEDFCSPLTLGSSLLLFFILYSLWSLCIEPFKHFHLVECQFLRIGRQNTGTPLVTFRPLALYSNSLTKPAQNSLQKSELPRGIQQRIKRSSLPFVIPIILFLAKKKKKSNSYQFNFLLGSRHYLILLKGTYSNQFNDWLVLGIF